MRVVIHRQKNNKSSHLLLTHIIIMKKLILASLLLVTNLTFSNADTQQWMTDFKAAKQKAAAENKDMLVNFTGSDWCGWCIKLVDEVFKYDSFKQGVADKFVLVEIDFPQDKSKLDAATQQQNEILKGEYSIQGFPTILLLDSEGLPYAQTGYQAGGPEKYLVHLDELRAIKEKRNRAIEDANKLEGTESAAALITAIEMIPEGQQNHYSDTIKQIAELDPDDQTGFLAAQAKKSAEKELQNKIMTAMKSGKTDGISALVDQFITDYKIVGEQKQNLLSAKINPLLASQKFDAVAQVINEIIAIDSDTRMGKIATKFLPRLKTIREQAAKPRVNPPHGQPGHIHNE